MTNLNKIADALIEETGKLDFTEQESHLFIQTLRLLSKGHPINSEQVSQIAVKEGLSTDEALAVLDWIVERNKDGNIAGLAGLSVNNWSHKFKVNGTELSTWCALDTMFLPQILNQTAEVESKDPGTKEIIKLSIGPNKVEHHGSSSTVISVVTPKTKKKGLESTEKIWKSFCCFSHYFTSVESGKKWFSGKNLVPVFLSMEEGHQLGYLWFKNIIKNVKNLNKEGVLL
jgi:alkylmercury lyase